MTPQEQVETDHRARVSTTKPINLEQLDEELGKHGLLVAGTSDDARSGGVEVEIVVPGESPVTQAQLEAAVDAHVAELPPTRVEILTEAVAALPDPTVDLDGFRAGLAALVANLTSP